MADFKRSGSFGANRRGGFNKGGSRPQYGGRQDFRPRGERDRNSQMFAATCAECKKSCEVPFRPTDSKPVFCNDCFRSKGESFSGGFKQRDKGSWSDKSPKREYTSHNGASTDNKKIDDLKRQIELAHNKLDRLILIVNNSNHSPVVIKRAKKEVDLKELSNAVDKAVTPTIKKTKKETKKKVVSKKKK